MLSRRAFIGRTGMTAAGLYAVTHPTASELVGVARLAKVGLQIAAPSLVTEIDDFDAQEEQKYWPEASRGSTTFHTYSGKNSRGEVVPPPTKPERTWLVFPGWGELGTENIAGYLNEVTGGHDEIRYLQLKNDTVDESEILKQFMLNMKNDPIRTRSVSILAHSMGMELFIRMYHGLIKNAYNPPVVEGAAMLSSPYGLETAHYSEPGAIAAESGVGDEYIGKFIGNLFMTLSRSHWTLDPHVLAQDISTAQQQTRTGADPDMLRSMTLILKDSDDIGSMLPVVAPYMRLQRAAYFGSNPASADNTVDAWPSYNRWNGSFKEVFQYPIPYIDNGAGHALYDLPTRVPVATWFAPA